MSRAQVPRGTVRIGKGGVARLSPDLYQGDWLMVKGFDQNKKQLRLQFHDGEWGVSVFKTAPGARSGSLAMKGLLKLYGLDRHIGGTYRGRLDGRELVIDFGRKVYDGNGSTAGKS